MKLIPVIKYKTLNSILSDYKKRETGFTLVELLVTISLIILFVTITLGYNRTADKQISLFREQGSIVNEIYKARSMSVTTFNRAGQDMSVPCGYGIHVESTSSIILFQEPASLNNSDCTNFNFIGSIYNQDPTKNVEVVNLTGVSLADSNVGMDILFIPPDPTVYFYPIQSGNSSIILSLSAPLISSPANIEVNQFGQISIQ